MKTPVRAPALAAALAIVLVACAEAPAGFQGSPDDVILRIATGGGFVPQEYALAELPEFTLYGDGRVVTLGAQIEIYPPPALPPLIVRTISDDAIEQIVQAARDAGLDEDNTYRNDMIADAATTTFTFTDGGTTFTTSAYALGFEGGAAEQDLADFRDKVTDLASWIDESELGEESAFTAEAVRVWVGTYRDNPELEQNDVAWPVEADLASLQASDDGAFGCATFDGTDAEEIRDAARGANQLSPWTDEGQRYAVVLRPLLPDESGCPA